MADASQFIVDIQPVVKASEAACVDLMKAAQEAEKLKAQVEAIDQSVGFDAKKQKRIIDLIQKEHPEFPAVQAQLEALEKELPVPSLTPEALKELIRIPGQIEVPNVKAQSPTKRSKLYL